MIVDTSQLENVIIIGGGPAGLAAAIYNARANLNPLVFAGSPPGGQLTLTSEVENYPGFESILGTDLIEKMRNQAVKFGTRIIDENVLRVDFSKKPFTIATLNKTYSTKTILIATGAKALWLGLESETRLRGKGVSACATCDGFFFKNKIVGVVGGGDTALEEALTLTKFAKHVIIIHRKGEFRASKIMQERVLAHPHIHELFNAQVIDMNGKEKINSVTVKITPSDQNLMQKSIEELEKIAPPLLQMKIEKKEGTSIVGTIPLDGLFIAIGHKPDTDLFKGQVEPDKKGYIVTTERIAKDNFQLEILNLKSNSNIKNLNIENSLKIENLELKIQKFDLTYNSQTSVPGVFAAGDCVDYVYRQAATAVGMGVAAALDIERYLESNF